MTQVGAFIRDIQFAVRFLLKSPTASGIAILALALGIGVNASSFIPISALILHPFPYPHLDRIATLWETLPKQHLLDGFSPANFLDIQKQANSFEKLACYRSTGIDLTGGEIPERVRGSSVSADFFSVFGGTALLGRSFLPEDMQHRESRAAVISYSFWKSHLASAPDVIGKSLSISRVNYRVVGVMPDRFDFPLSAEIWLPLVFDSQEQQQRDTHDLMALGLLKPGVSAPQASAEAATIASRLAVQYPRSNQGSAMRVLTLRDYFANDGRVTSHFVLVLLSAATFVLLLACANIGNLQLARAANRQKEIALRTALGASPVQIARQLIVESVLISLLAGILGLVLASWNSDLGKSSIPAAAMRQVPGLRTMGVDSTVVLLTLGVSLVAGIVCCIPSILQLLRPIGSDLSEVLRERASSFTGSTARSGVRTALIVFELSLALVLLVGAGLMVRTFESLLTRYQGFDPNNLLTAQVSLPASGYGTPAQMRSLYERALRKLAELPGVAAPGLSSELGAVGHLHIEGRPELGPGEPQPAFFSVNNRYLESMRIPLIEGRFLSDQDHVDSPALAVISKSVARHYWPKSSPIGQRISLQAKGYPEWFTIVGISGDVIENWFEGDPSLRAYISYSQSPAPWAELDVRTSADPKLAAPGVRGVFRSLDRSITLYDVKTKDQANFEERSGVYAAARAMSTYAIVALLLAVTGIYAVVAYFVAARTHDIGIHIALGASRAEVLKMTMGQTMKLVLVALAIGLPVSVLLGKTMSSVLYGVVTLEPSTFALFAIVLTGSALLASYLPSRRATQIDPMIALRDE